MKNRNRGIWLTISFTILIFATLCVWPAFRTAAQQKNKPANTENKSQKHNPASKPATNGPGRKNSDVDQQDIQKAMEEVQKSMQEFQEKDWPKVQVEIEKAMKEIDMVKIQQEIQASMKEVDMEKIQAEVKNAMKEIDVEKICAEVNKAMKSIDMKAIEKELAAVKKINTEELSREMAKVKEELARTKIDLNVQIANAKEQMKKANAQLLLMKQGLDELEKDGLKKKGEKINIEYKNGVMYLNGAPQSKQVSDKYKKYFGSGDFNLNLNDDDDNNNDNNNRDDRVK